MEAFHAFTSEKRKKIEQAIAEAEVKTSGEIRVHIEDECLEDPMERAAYIFEELEMHETEERNGVLIYLSYVDHKLAILGDKNINDRVPDNFWDSIVSHLTLKFKTGEYTEGLVDAIQTSGQKLSEFFPHSGKDKNELDNEVTFG